MTSGDDHGRAIPRSALRRLGWSILFLPLCLVLLLFLPVGRFAWTSGWLFVGVLLLASFLACVYLWRVNPEIFFARSQIHPGTKRWDLVVIAVELPLMATIFPIAALDDGWFHWSNLPWWVRGIGYVLFLAGVWLLTWAQAVNKFFEPGVRIQTDRGHRVIDTGPYARVRHPGYAAALLLVAGIPLALGSLWALIPAALSTVVLMLRTRWEEQTLRTELPGYEAYTQRVRSRWIPGVW